VAECRDAALNLDGIANVDGTMFDTQRRCHGLDDSELADASDDRGVP
jgi:hypothetical protein